MPAKHRSVVFSNSRIAITLIATFVLTACGGGGGGSNSPPSSPATPPPPPPPANTAPTVNAGTDQSIQLPTNAVNLTGSATDAENNTLTYTWAASPAAGVAFDNTTAAATRATFTTAGTYTLTLTANDGTLSGTDTLQVTVAEAAPPPPANNPPTAAAGADQSIELPISSVALQGSGTDPDTSQTLTYAWTANPAAGVTFDNPASATARATFASAATYVLTLTVSDGTANATDDVQVVVAAPLYPGADVETDPNHGWTQVAAADVGMNDAKLAEAEAYALTGGGGGLIARRGRLVRKWGDIDARSDLKSTTKSMGGIALGIALDQNLLALGDIAQTKLPGIGADPTDLTPNDPAKLALITIRQLATHTAGFAKDGSSKVDLVRDPGTAWIYSDGGLNWLADTLTNVFQQDLSALMTTNVWTPLGITTDDLVWRAVTAGTRPAVGTLQLRELNAGITANPNAMARVGLLFLRKGVWNGQRIVSEAFVQTASTPRPETAATELVDPAGFPSANQGYGLLWWTNATRQLADVPADAYWAWGLGDSLIIVIPSLDLVIARTGSNPDDATLPHWRSGWNGNYTVLQPFLAPIVQSVSP